MRADADPARVGTHETGDDLDERGLARTVVTYQADDLAGRDREVEAVERATPAVALHQSLGDEHPASIPPLREVYAVYVYAVYVYTVDP